MTRVACIVGAIIGGGVKLLQVELRVVESLWRQYLLAAFGLVLIVAALSANGNLGVAAGYTKSSADHLPMPPLQGNAIGPTEPSSSKNAMNPENLSDAGPTEDQAPASRAQPVETNLAPELTADDLRSALRFEIGDPTGLVIAGRAVRRVKIWLELPTAERRSIRSVRYEFYDSDIHSPKYPERGSQTFATSWPGYGCIDDAAVVAQSTQGEVKARFNFCTLWDQGHL